MVSDGEKSMNSRKLNKAFALCALLIASTGLVRGAAAVSIYTGPDLPVPTAGTSRNLSSFQMRKPLRPTQDRQAFCKRQRPVLMRA
jgi:hypothetical protein